MDLTRDDVEFKAPRRAHGDGGGMSAASRSAARPAEPRTASRRLGSSAPSGRSCGSLRSTRWSLLAATVLTIGFPILAAAVDLRTLGASQPARSARASTRSTSAWSASQLAQLAIGVLGVLVITGEYSTGNDPRHVHRRAEAAARAVGEGRRLRGGHVRADAARGADRVLREPGDPLAPPRLQIAFSACRRRPRGDRRGALPDGRSAIFASRSGRSSATPPAASRPSRRSSS